MKKGKQNPFQSLIFKNLNFERWFWLPVFSSIDCFHTGNKQTLQNRYRQQNTYVMSPI